MTLNTSKFSPVVSIHVIGKHIICFKWKPYETYRSPPERKGFVSCHIRYFFKDMVDCLSEVSHTIKRENFGVKQYDDSCHSDLRQNSKHLCFKPENNIMQKSQQSFDPNLQKQNDMSPSSVEQNCVEKAEKPQNVWQRRDSFSSCSSDSAVYCSTRHTQVNVPDEPVRILSCENSHVDMTCESKRQRHSSGSSVISIASDASCKEPQPGLGRKNILSCLAASSKLGETDTSDINENVISGSHVKKTKPTLVSVSKAKQETVLEVNLPIDTQEKMSQSSPPAVRLHDLRKNIRRKACCHGDCNETHTTFIVRRYTEVHHPNPAHQHSSNTSSSKRSVPSSSTSNSSLDSSPNSNKKRKSEIDKLFAALHEIKWAKHFSPETILQHTEARRTSCTIKSLNPAESSTGPGLPSSPLSRGRVDVKSKFPVKSTGAKNKISSEKDTKPKDESFSIRNRPSIHFLNTKNQQSHKLNSGSPPKSAHKVSWLSTKKKLSEHHILQRSPEALFSDSADSNRQDYAEMLDVEDNLGSVQSDLCDLRGKHSPIFLQIASTTKNSRTTPKSQSHVHEPEAIDVVVSADSSPQSNNVELTFDLESGAVCGNAQSAVISAKDNTPLQVSICESQNHNFPLEHSEQDVDISKTETVNSDCAPLIPLCGNTDRHSDLDSCEKQHNTSAEFDTQENVGEDQSQDESCITNSENHSSHNESLELPLLSSEDSPVKDAPFNEMPPVLEPCVSLPTTVQHQKSPLSLCESHTSHHSSQNSTTGHESDSERSRASSPDMLFVALAKCHKNLEQNIENCCKKEDQQEKQDIPASETSSSSYSLKKLSGRNRTEPKNCDVSCSKRASRLILKKYVKNSNRKANNHKHKDSAWNEDEGKTWRCVVVDADQDHDSDEENNGLELLNHKIASPVASAETVNGSGIENNSYDDTRTSTPKKYCEYKEQSVCDSALLSHSDKSQHSLSSGSHATHMKKVAHSSSGVNKSQNSPFQVAHKRHKSGKILHLKDKVNCKKSKKATAIDNTTNGNKNVQEDKKELPQEVIRLRMLYGFTFHYKGITVNKNDSYTQVILKLTTRGSIFLSVEALMELKDTLNSAGNDSNCQVLIINGIGNSFCSGLDLRPLMGPRKKDAAREMAVAVKDFIEALASFHKPLVSVVNGSAVGLGVTLLTYSDVVLASDTASFHMPYAQLGYMPEGAVTLTLPQVMRSSVAMDMLLRGTKITAHQACDHGLVSEVLEAKKLPQQLVSRVRILAESPVSAMESTKSMLRWHLHGKLHVALENEVQMLPKQWLSPACQIAIKNAFQNGLLCE